MHDDPTHDDPHPSAPRPSPPRRATGNRSAARESIEAAALRIVDEAGGDALTIRELASRTHYAVSTVSYHTGQQAEFRDHVWRNIGSGLATEVFTPRAPVPEQVRRLEAWIEAHPRRSEFFASHAPTAPHRTDPGFWAFLGGVEHADPEDVALISVLQLLSRRLQALVEFLLRCPTAWPHRASVVEAELRSLGDAWVWR